MAKVEMKMEFDGRREALDALRKMELGQISMAEVPERLPKLILKQLSRLGLIPHRSGQGGPSGAYAVNVSDLGRLIRKAVQEACYELDAQCCTGPAETWYRRLPPVGGIDPEGEVG